MQWRLNDIAVTRDEVEEVTDLLSKTDTRVGGSDNSVNEEVEEFGLVVGEYPPGEDCQIPPVLQQDQAAAMVNFDMEDKDEGEKSQDLARHIKVDFDVNDIKFWFSQLEDEMELASIGKQWLKKTVLQRILPVKQKEDVKSFLTLQKAYAGDHIYHDIKTALIRTYALKPQDSYRRALTRTMVGLPSQLGYQIVDDVCKKPSKMDGCCCASNLVRQAAN